MKTTIAIRKWIKETFKSESDFAAFLEFVRMHSFVQNGRRLLPVYQAEYDTLKASYETLYNSIADLPEIQVTERFGRETHISMQNPLYYMSYFFGHDAKRRHELFKVV